MASEYLKKLAREQKIEEVKHEMTDKEKRQNWWYYHKYHVLIAVVALVLLGFMIKDLFFNREPEPDYQVAYIGSTYLPEDTAAALETELARMGGDLNQDGQVVVKVREYPLYADEANYQTVMSAQVQLSVDVGDCESFIFLMEDPERFQEDFELLTYPDGTLPEGNADGIWYAWTDCPVLMDLQLGEYTEYTTGGTIVGSNREVLESLYIARRYVPEEYEGTKDGAIALWEQLIAGATE